MEKGTNKLSLEQTILLPDFVDNLKCDDVTGHIYAGVLPSGLFGMRHLKPPKVAPDAPGGVTEIQYSQKDKTWETRNIVNTGMQNLVSNALRMGNYVFLGTFYMDGFVACPIDDTIPFDNWVAYLNTRGIYDMFIKSLNLMYDVKGY